MNQRLALKKIPAILCAVGLALLFPSLQTYFSCPTPKAWEEMAKFYRQRARKNDNVFVAPPWMAKRAMDWSRFGMIVPMNERDLLDPPEDATSGVWIFDYGDYFAIHSPRIKQQYRILEYHKSGSGLRAYVLEPK